MHRLSSIWWVGTLCVAPAMRCRPEEAGRLIAARSRARCRGPARRTGPEMVQVARPIRRTPCGNVAGHRASPAKAVPKAWFGELSRGETRTGTPAASRSNGIRQPSRVAGGGSSRSWRRRRTRQRRQFHIRRHREQRGVVMASGGLQQVATSTIGGGHGGATSSGRCAVGGVRQRLLGWRSSRFGSGS
jgi:hypothetical protein